MEFDRRGIWIEKFKCWNNIFFVCFLCQEIMLKYIQKGDSGKSYRRSRFHQDIAHLMILGFQCLLVNSTHCSKSHSLWMFSDSFESSAMSDQGIESHLIGGWKSCGLTQRQRHHDDRPPRSSDHGHLSDQCIAKADTLLSKSAQPVRGLKVFPTAPHLCKVACPI